MQVYLAYAKETGCFMNKEIDGVTISYTLSGTGNGKVLLLHGWGCDGSLMQPVAKALQESFQVLVPDFPGHGNSGRPPAPWGVPDYADCLKSFLQATGFYPCHVIAHSFGCRVATWLAAASPELFEKIVFTGAAGIRPKQSEEAKKKSQRYRTLKNICEIFRNVPGLSILADKCETALRQKYGSKDYNALDEEMRRTFVKVINQDLSELYPHFHSSTLLIWGDQDTETPLWMGKQMEKSIPDAGLVILEGGTHFAYLEQNARFNTIISRFLKEE